MNHYQPGRDFPVAAPGGVTPNQEPQLALCHKLKKAPSHNLRGILGWLAVRDRWRMTVGYVWNTVTALLLGAALLSFGFALSDLVRAVERAGCPSSPSVCIETMVR